MTITREQVADLREGDVVEITDEEWEGLTVRGPVRADGAFGALIIGPDQNCYFVRQTDGGPGSRSAHRTLTVVSRAPRPLYVNHDRTEPVRGDVARDAEDAADVGVYLYIGGTHREWVDNTCRAGVRRELPRTLRLLVDGETGQVVQP